MMNKKSNFMNNKKTNHQRLANNNNNSHNGQQGHKGVRGGRGRSHFNNNNNRRAYQNHWNNQKTLMQRIYDGAIVTLLSNAIATASSANNSSPPNPNHRSLSTVGSSPSNTLKENVIHDDKQDEKDVSKGTATFPSSHDNTLDIKETKEPADEQEKNEEGISEAAVPSSTPPSQNNCDQLVASTHHHHSHQIIQNNNIQTTESFGGSNPLLQTFLASILQNQIIINNDNSRRCDKGTQTVDRIPPLVSPSCQNLIQSLNNLSFTGFQQQQNQQQIISKSNLETLSNYKFQGLAKTSSVYFTRGIR